MIYPVSEIFVSPQGEGVWAGTSMCFVRLAGCTVGKPYKKGEYDDAPNPLSIYTEQCTFADGRKFPCDTDYRVKDRLSAEEITHRIPNDVKRVCITGGEPMMHDLSTLLSYLWGKFKKVHIETSGTITQNLPQDVWVTVSPKWGVLEEMLFRSNEIKLLVDKDFKPDPKMIGEAKKKPVYLQPINNEHTIREENVRLCLEWQERYPDFRVCLQLHKVLSLYTAEVVR